MYACESEQRQQELEQSFGGREAFRPQYEQQQQQQQHAASSSFSYPWGYSPTHQEPSSASPTRGFIAVSVITVDIGVVASDYGQKTIPMVARVTLIDSRGAVLLDTYVQPTHRITDYRTDSTGLNYLHFQGAPTFDVVQCATAKLIYNNVIVGHRLWDFLSVMGLSHPAIDTRDLALYRPLRKRLKSRYIVDLKTLVRFFVGKEIGLNYEDPLENALAAMDLFRVIHQTFESKVQAGAWPCHLPPISFARYFL